MPDRDLSLDPVVLSLRQKHQCEAYLTMIMLEPMIQKMKNGNSAGGLKRRCGKLDNLHYVVRTW
jgi:hypothetical protein